MEWVFGSGVRLDNERRMALRNPLRILPTPEELILPVCPEKERQAWTIAAPGDLVSPERAAALSEACGRAVCPPVSARVTGVEPRLMPRGESWVCLLLSTKGVESEKGAAIQRHSPRLPSREEVIRAAAAAGLVDELDGEDLADKFRRMNEAHIDMLVCDAVCDDPYNSDSLRALVETTEDVQMGLDLAGAGAGCRRVMVVTSRAADATGRAARSLKARMTVPYIDVDGNYPIWVNLQQQAPFKGKKIGRIGVQACLRLLRAVRRHRPPERSIITVGGPALREAVHYSVTIGTPISKVLERCDVASNGYRTVVVYSAITGECVADTENTPVTQDTRCILAFDQLPPVPRSCMGCGRCCRVCPTGVLPMYAMQAMEKGDKDRAAYFGLQRCIDCRACEVACPANIPLAARLLRAAAKEPQPMELWRNRGETPEDT